MTVYDFVFSRQVAGTRIIGFFAKYGELPTVFHIIATNQGRENLRTLEGRRNTRDKTIYMIPLIIWVRGNRVLLEKRETIVKIPKNRLRQI